MSRPFPPRAHTTRTDPVIGTSPRKVVEAFPSAREESPLLRFPGEKRAETLTLTPADRLIVSSASTRGTDKKQRRSGIKLLLLTFFVALAGLGAVTLFRVATDLLGR